MWDFCDYLPKRAEANTTYSITCKSQYLPGKIATSVKLSTGYTGRALSFAKVQVIAENDCKKDMEGKSYRCEACQTKFTLMVNPHDNTQCIPMNDVKQVTCKRGHRIDQIKFLNHNG